MGNQMDHQKKGTAEAAWHSSGLVVAGVDEVGRGALAGPVVAGSVILNWEIFPSLPPRQKSLMADSKSLSAAARKEACELIKSVASAYAIFSVRPEIIDRLGIHKASLMAMAGAASALDCPCDLLVVDGSFMLPNLNSSQVKKQMAINKADQNFYGVAAASIIAKVYRDHLMTRLSLFPHYQPYDFPSHKGYPTSTHKLALNAYGVSPLHRKSYRPVAKALTDSRTRATRP